MLAFSLYSLYSDLWQITIINIITLQSYFICLLHAWDTLIFFPWLALGVRLLDKVIKILLYLTLLFHKWDFGFSYSLFIPPCAALWLSWWGVQYPFHNSQARHYVVVTIWWCHSNDLVIKLVCKYFLLTNNDTNWTIL